MDLEITYVDASGQGFIVRISTEFFDDGSSEVLSEEVVKAPNMTFTQDNAWEKDPDSQPNPEDVGSGESMHCPATHRDCGPGTEAVSDEDLVSQPGADDAGTGGFTASIAERKDVVTNPVDPENHMRHGGGRQPRPIQHVTKPK